MTALASLASPAALAPLADRPVVDTDTGAADWRALGTYVEVRTVDVHVGRLRKALIRGKERDPIRTVRGSGYVFGERPGA